MWNRSICTPFAHSVHNKKARWILINTNSYYAIWVFDNWECEPQNPSTPFSIIVCHPTLDSPMEFHLSVFAEDILRCLAWKFL